MRRRKRRKMSILVPVASMGDIAFLLIIFFMLCSNFAKESGIPLTPPKEIQLDELQKATLSVQIDADGKLYFQGAPIGGPESLVSLLEEKIKDLPTEKRVVLFTCDASINDPKLYNGVLEAINRGGAEKIAALGVEGKP